MQQVEWEEKAKLRLSLLHDYSGKYFFSRGLVQKLTDKITDPNNRKNMDRELDFSNLQNDEIRLFYLLLYTQKFKSFNLLKTSDSYFVLDLCMNLEKREVKKNEAIYLKDEPAANLFFVYEGEIGYMLNRFDNIPFVKVTPGSYFGEYELMFNVPRVFNCRALKDSTIYYLSISHFKKLLIQDQDDSFVRRFHNAASERLNYFTSVHNQFESKIRSELMRKDKFKVLRATIENAYEQSRRARKNMFVQGSSSNLKINFNGKRYSSSTIKWSPVDGGKQHKPVVSKFTFDQEEEKERLTSGHVPAVSERNVLIKGDARRPQNVQTPSIPTIKVLDAIPDFPKKPRKVSVNLPSPEEEFERQVPSKPILVPGLPKTIHKSLGSNKHVITMKKRTKKRRRKDSSSNSDLAQEFKANKDSKEISRTEKVQEMQKALDTKDPDSKKLFDDFKKMCDSKPRIGKKRR